jgi:hypothetical protein
VLPFPMINRKEAVVVVWEEEMGASDVDSLILTVKSVGLGNVFEPPGRLVELYTC